MKYVLVRTYGNGMHINSIYPEIFKYISTAMVKAKELNKEQSYNEDYWVPMALHENDSCIHLTIYS